jgi:ABC-2 type transport system permease protein
VYYSEVDPLGESRIVLGTLNYTNELNKATVADAFRRGQGRAGDIREALARIDEALGRISDRMDRGESDQAAADAAQVRNETDAIVLGAGLMLQILRSAPVTGAQPTTTTQGQNLSRTEDSIRRLNADVTALQAELESPTPDRERVRTRVEAVRADVRDVQGLTTQFESINPYVLVAPFFGQTQNLAGSTSFVNFYTPGAIALLLQHIAITLGALSMVRERMRGSLEMFRVSPITPGEILVGKYLGFMIFLAVLAVLLLGLIVFGLGVPMRGDYLWLALTLLLLVFASLGLGFSISMISSTESQAVQLAMLTLLMSVFFGGFFLNIESFWPPVQVVSYALPVTHGITSLQDVMLRGREPRLFYPLMLLGLGLFFGFFAMWRFLREFRRG